MAAETFPIGKGGLIDRLESLEADEPTEAEQLVSEPSSFIGRPLVGLSGRR